MGKDMLAADGSLEFKLRWADPLSSEANHWKRASNPVANAKKKIGGVTGYEPISIKQAGNGWGGLEYNANGDSLLDGELGSNNWFYAIGYSGAAPLVEVPRPLDCERSRPSCRGILDLR